MRFIELQIIAMILALVSATLLVFKKKNGWLLQVVVATLFLILNYKAELYFLAVPCIFSGIVSLCGWFKWRRDEKNILKEVK